MNTLLRFFTPDAPTDTAISMDEEIRLVSRFRALILGRIIVSLSLFLYLLCTMGYGYRPTSPIYILGVLNIFSWPIEALLAPYVKKRTIVLPYLRKHYRYSSLRFASNNIISFLTCLLLLLWQICQDTTRLPVAWFRFVPLTLLVIMLLFRTIAPFFLAKQISRRLLSGKY
ncbi:MAG: hypothetical protein IJY09_09095 [Lachnospiraceae bacterium]|nr:hypothetical protein [Lachnospiraceae bacterium]